MKPIQIWQPVDGRWVRPAPGPFGDHHSATRVLHPRRPDGPPRVLLVGESVAAGYLLAPAHTPAAVLTDLLPGHDVVDLARTDETLASLTSTLEAAAQLQPDVVVIWAGNNWLMGDLAHLSPYHERSTSVEQVGAALRAGGTAAAETWAGNAVVAALRPGLNRLSDLAGRHGWRLIVIVPEVNRFDWPHVDPPLAGASNGSAELEVTHGLLRGTSAAPMATPTVQRLLHEWAFGAGHDAVDVRALIDRPDRRWFYDYCHHTVDGIQRVMQAVAAKISPGPLGSARPPEGAVRATAAIGAMLHTAHRLVNPAARPVLLAHWRDMAIAADPAAAHTFADIVDSRLSLAPAVLTEAQRRNRDGPHPLGLMHGWRPQGIDAQVLVTLGAGADPRAATRCAVRPWTGVEEWAPGHRDWSAQWAVDRHGGSALLRARTGRVTVVHHQTDRDQQREVVLRLPRPGRVVISVGSWSVRRHVGCDWARVAVTIPASAAPPGLLPLHLDLPRHSVDRDSRLLQLHPAQGEIWSIR